MTQLRVLALSLLVTLGSMGQSCPQSRSFLIAAPGGGSHFDAAAALTIQVETTAASGLIHYVEFVHNGEVVHTDTTAPYTAPWTITAADNGSHRWQAVAYAAAGSFGSPSVDYTVSIPSGGDPQLVGLVPGAGTARDVVLDEAEGLAYVASDEFGLSVVDVSDPAAPVAIGAALPSFGGNHLARDGDLAVVAAGDGLRVVDVSDPLLPAVLATLEGNWKGVAMAGDFAFGRLSIPGNPSHEDLAVVDLRTPDSPVVAFQTYLPWGDRVVLDGSRLYVTSGTALQVFDVSNPLAPQARGSVEIPGGASELAVANGHVFVGNSTTIHAVSVTNPWAPQLVGSVAGGSWDLDGAGTRLYACNGGTLHVYDVANPAAPTWLGSGTGFVTARSVAAAGGVAYLASPAADGDGGLYAMDVGNPTSPSVLSQAPNASASNRDVAAEGSIGVATSGSALEVLDLSDPSLPSVVGSLPGSFKGVVVSGGFAFARLNVAGNPAHDDLVVVDLGNPSNPQIVAQHYLGWGDSVALEGSTLFATAAGALHAFDVANPLAPQSLGSLAVPNGATVVVVGADHAYVGNASGIQVVDVSSPQTMSVVASVAGYTKGLAIAGSTLHALSGTSFRSYDVSTPGAPVMQGTASGFASSWGIGAMGQRVFLASPSGDGSVVVYDVSNPGAPQLESEFAVPGGARSVAPLGALLLVGDDSATVDVFQL